MVFKGLRIFKVFQEPKTWFPGFLFFSKIHALAKKEEPVPIKLDNKNFTKNIIKQINKLEYKYILIEGGSKTISEFINNKYIDLLQFIIAPVIIGSGINSLNLKKITNLKKAIRPKYSYNFLSKEFVINLFLNS